MQPAARTLDAGEGGLAYAQQVRARVRVGVWAGVRVRVRVRARVRARVSSPDCCAGPIQMGHQLGASITAEADATRRY